MKIGLILFAAFKLIWSIELGTASFRYLVGLNLLWTFVACAGFSILYLNIYYFSIEEIRRLLIKKWPSFGNWLNKIESKNYDWIKWCYRKGYWGLFLATAVPHFELAGVAAQKLLRLKYGYWVLAIGTIVKAGAFTFGGIKVFEYLVQCLQN